MSRNAGTGENGDSGRDRDRPNMLANLTIFMQITSADMSLTCWRIWRFLCKKTSPEMGLTCWPI